MRQLRQFHNRFAHPGRAVEYAKSGRLCCFLRDSAGWEEGCRHRYFNMMNQHSISIRVRYPEVDAMGYLHHSRFFQYFEMGRVELLRNHGFNYAELEREGIFFVVVKVECRYKAPARYDEELTLTTRIVKRTHVRIDHAYELKRGDTLLAEAATTVACVGRDGQLQQIPEGLRADDI